MDTISHHYTAMNETGVVMWSGTLKRMIAVKGCVDTVLMDRPAYHELMMTASCVRSINASIVGRLTNRYTAWANLKKVGFDVKAMGQPMSAEQQLEARKSCAYYWEHRNDQSTRKAPADIEAAHGELCTIQQQILTNQAAGGTPTQGEEAQQTTAFDTLSDLIRPLVAIEMVKGTSRVKGSYLYWAVLAPIYYKVMNAGEKNRHNDTVKKWKAQEIKRKIKRLETLCREAGLPEKEYLTIMGHVEEKEYRTENDDPLDLDTRIQQREEQLKELNEQKLKAFSGTYAGLQDPTPQQRKNNTLNWDTSKVTCMGVIAAMFICLSNFYTFIVVYFFFLFCLHEWILGDSVFRLPCEYVRFRAVPCGSVQICTISCLMQEKNFLPPIGGSKETFCVN
jgi:hypothetical protein